MPTWSPSSVVLTLCLVLVTLIAAAVDVRSRKLPNRLVVPVFFSGLLFHLVFGALEGGWQGAGQGLLLSLGGFGVGFGVLLVLWLIGGGGGGDVKYMGALGAWLGPERTVYVLVAAGFLVAVGSVLVLAYQVFRKGFSATKRRYLTPASHSSRRRASKQTAARQRAEAVTRRRLLPFAVPAALATWGVLIVTQFIFPK